MTTETIESCAASQKTARRQLVRTSFSVARAVCTHMYTRTTVKSRAARPAMPPGAAPAPRPAGAPEHQGRHRLLELTAGLRGAVEERHELFARVGEGRGGLPPPDELQELLLAHAELEATARPPQPRGVLRAPGQRLPAAPPAQGLGHPPRLAEDFQVDQVFEPALRRREPGRVEVPRPQDVVREHELQAPLVGLHQRAALPGAPARRGPGGARGPAAEERKGPSLAEALRPARAGPPPAAPGARATCSLPRFWCRFS